MWCTTKRPPQMSAARPERLILVVNRHALEAAIVVYDSRDGTVTSHGDGIDHVPLTHYDWWTSISSATAAGEVLDDHQPR